MPAISPLRMLFWTREEFRTFRVDIDVLFGRELIGRGHLIDLVMEGCPGVTPGAHPWYGRRVLVGRTAGSGAIGRLVRHLATFAHDLHSLLTASRSRYDAIQFRDKFLIAALALPVARLRGQKYFYWLSFPYPEDDLLRASSGSSRFPRMLRWRGKVAAWLLYRWILPRADHGFVQSEQMKRDIEAWGISSDRMTSVPMGVDLGDIPSPAQSRSDKASAQPIVLGYLGTLNAERHIEMLVEMLALLRARHADVRLLLIGDAQQRADRLALERRARQLGVSAWVEITGALPRAQALQQMLTVDIALSPFFPTPMLLSTSPTKLMEYLALGLPVVASQHPEQRVILSASGAGVSAPWGARHFARSVQWLLRRSPEERASMGQAGRAWVQQNRTYGKIADDLERKYGELMRSTASPQKAVGEP